MRVVSLHFRRVLHVSCKRALPFPRIYQSVSLLTIGVLARCLGRQKG